MATRSQTAANKLGPWEMTEDLETSDGYTVWAHSETGAEVKLAGGLKPTKKILDTLAMNMPDMSPSPHTDDNRSFADVTDEDESPVSRVLTILGAGDKGGRSEIKVYRQLDHSGERYCGMFTPEQFEAGDVELIRRNWGGGKYRVAVYGTTSRFDLDGVPKMHGGKFVRMGQTFVEIEDMRIEAVAAPGGSGGNESLVQLITQLNNRVNEISRGPQSAPTDFMTQMETFARIQKMLGGETKKKSVMEEIKEMEAMLGLRKKLAGERGDGDGEGKEKTMMDLAGDVLPMLKEIIAGGGNRPAAPQADIPQIVTPPALAGVPQNEPDQLNGEPEVKTGELFMLNVMVGAILTAAGRGDPTEKHAVGLAEKLPDEAAEILDNPLWFEILGETLPARVPELEKHKAWLSKLRDEIIAAWDAEPPTT